MINHPKKSDCNNMLHHINTQQATILRSDIRHVSIEWGSRGNGVTHKVIVITGSGHKHKELFRSYRTRDIYCYLCGYHDRGLSL